MLGKRRLSLRAIILFLSIISLFYSPNISYSKNSKKNITSKKNISNKISSKNTSSKYVTAKPKTGEALALFLSRYELPQSQKYISKLQELNPKRFDKKGRLLQGVTYKLPIRIFNYNGKSLSGSIGIDKESLINKIDDYNNRIFKKGLKESSYKKSKIIWVPFHYLENQDNEEKNSKSESQSSKSKSEKSKQKKSESNKSDSKKDDPKKDELKLEKQSAKSSKNEEPDTSTEPVKSGKDTNKDDIKPEKLKKNGETLNYPIFGKKYQKVEIIDNELEGMVYYLDAGHGGPDPGAIGKKDGHRLCEDEYAYDFVLRLGRNLLQHSATVYFTIQDPYNGIRDQELLDCDENERLLGDEKLSDNNRMRLKRRAEIVNGLYEKHKKNARGQQLVVIHVDSRTVDKRVDIFFYYKPGNQLGNKLANTLHQTLKTKYETRAGREYFGTVTSRNLYMLRNTEPLSVYIELGNIQNQRNQVRLLLPDNRQAVANWLCTGLIKASKEIK